MKEYRYGTFRLADNLRPLTAICIFVLFSVMSTVLNLSFFFTLVPALLAFLYAWQIMQLHREQFVLRSDLILVFMGRKTHTISLPAKITCVISYADVCTPLDTPASLRGALHTQRNRYAVSILQRMLMYGKVSQENYVELTAASAIPNKEIKSPQILRH